MKHILGGLFAFFVLSAFANAQIVINEAQILPIDKRFIELYNIGDSDIDLTGWYIQRKTATGGSFNSLITKTDFENKTIRGGGYFLISHTQLANANSDIVKNLTLTESNALRIRNSKGEDVDKLEWESIGDGKSYQRMSPNEWVIASSTPGLANSISDEEIKSSQAQSSSSNSSINDFPTEQQIFANAGKDRIVTVGADSLFEGRALGLQKEPLEGARYVWNFGNGETKEGQNVLHYYKYPGEYAVMLSVSSGQYSASDRIIVNAYQAELVISKVEDDFIEIFNKSKQELNLSWWQIQSGSKRFMIPKDTIILPNKKLIFSSDITKLDASLKENVSLLYPNGAKAVSFEQIKIPQKIVATEAVTAKLSQGKELKKQTEEAAEIAKEIPEDTSQTGSVISGFNNLGGDKNNNSGISKWFLAIFGIVAVSVAVILIGKGKKEPDDDIEIVE